MIRAGFKSILVFVASLLFATASFADEDTKVTRDNSRLAVFVQPSISFLSFDQRSYFQNAIDTIYNEFLSQAVDSEESLYVAKQDFQKVNFCFPVMGGLQFQFLEGQFLSTGIGFIYDNESVVLADRKNNSHSYSYTIQGIPLFLEYRIAIPTSLITLSNGGLFSIALRWYWTLPGTEIYTTWGKLEADNKPWGAGFGVSLGYLLASWNGFNVYGDIGFSSISVESKESFADIVPDGPTEKAEWDIGGIQLQIRVSFGVINKPKQVPGDSTKVRERGNGGKPGKIAQREIKNKDEDAKKTEETPKTENAPKAEEPLKSGDEPKAEETVKTEDSAKPTPEPKEQ